MERLEYGSTPEVGSSRITTLAPPTNAKATDNFLCMPPGLEHHKVPTVHIFACVCVYVCDLYGSFRLSLKQHLFRPERFWISSSRL